MPQGNFWQIAPLPARKDAMNTVTHRLAAALALGAAATPSQAASLREATSGLSGLVIAAAWLLLLAWGFIFLLRRHLHFGELIDDVHEALSSEREARQLAERTAAEAHGALCRMADAQDSVRDMERQRIARDIHDDLGQHLLAMKIELSLLHLSTAGAHPALNQKLGNIISGLDMTVQSLRAVINDLRPLGLETGLRDAIATHLEEFGRLNGIACQFDAGTSAVATPACTRCEATIYRVLQEALANIARHAQATHVRVALLQDDCNISMTVQDNGVGMSMHAPGGRGCGLDGIRRRIAAAGGQFAIDSTAGVGTRLWLSVPAGQAIAMH
jgi:signal transduction histidine kinase